MGNKYPNKNLHAAKQAKSDEFYTQRPDIERELRHYKAYFKGKVVFCNCDDPYESWFFKYFSMKFNDWNLKKLIATCYTGSPVVSEQLSLLDVKSLKGKITDPKLPHKIEITEVIDANGDGAIDLSDVKYLLTNERNALSLLKGDGDFRSSECIELLEQADIVVTNPPFSLFREYVAQLMEYNKKFIIIGNMNAITYKEIFKLIKEGKIWLGQSIHSGDREFQVPEYYPLNAANHRTDENGHKYIRVKGVRWFTNLDYKERHDDLITQQTYHGHEDEYPIYDNFDAINVDKTSDIPGDYEGIMGVPISFLDKYNPDQFEIIGNEQYLNIAKGACYINGRRLYSRIFIKNKKVGVVI